MLKTTETDNNIKELLLQICSEKICETLGDAYFFSGSDLYSGNISPDLFSPVPEDIIDDVADDFMNSIEEQLNKYGQIDKESLRLNFKNNITQKFSYCYDCTRVWSAWSYGTMTADDFCLISDDEDRLNEFVDIGFDISEQAISYFEKNKLTNIINNKSLKLTDNISNKKRI